MSRAGVGRQQLDPEQRRVVIRRTWVPGRGLVNTSLDRHPVEVVAARSPRGPGSAQPRGAPLRTPSVTGPTATFEGRRANAVRVRRRRTARRRFVVVLGVCAVAVILVATLHGGAVNTGSYPAPSEAALAGLSVPQRIVAIAESQVGYRTNPSNSYCNKFSADWAAGTGGCPSGESSEEWCADFAAWAWHEAGVPFSYGYSASEINGGAVSFYEWAVATGNWHPATSGYVASPGDVAVYGLTLGTQPSAAHVAIVTDDAPGQQGPNVVNGDGDRTGFSVVETGTDEAIADTGRGDATLAGYVSPPPDSA